MVGLIQKILVDLILKIDGEEKLRQIKTEANIPADRTFRIDTVYSDEEWQRFFAVTLKVLNVTKEQAYEAYAALFYEDTLRLFPMWFQISKNSFEFLNSQTAIHNNFASGVSNERDREAINDKFKVEKFEKKLITYYYSANKHCERYTALANHIITHYKDKADISEEQCMLSGADHCKIVIEWSEFSNAQHATCS